MGARLLVFVEFRYSSEVTQYLLTLSAMRERVIGASMSEPHTSVLNRNLCVCVCVCVCLSVSYVLVLVLINLFIRIVLA